MYAVMGRGRGRGLENFVMCRHTHLRSPGLSVAGLASVSAAHLPEGGVDGYK
jgi:hypothetical protein